MTTLAHPLRASRIVASAISNAAKSQPRLATRDFGALRREARKAVREFLWLQSDDKPLAERCTQILHGPICIYAASQHRIKVRRKGRGHIYEYAPTGNLAVASLKRLDRHLNKPGYHWIKAWAELTPTALKLILSALPEPLTSPIGKAPNPATIRPVLEGALQKASSPRVSTTERDHAVVAILQAYQEFYQTAPRNPKTTKGAGNKTLSFIAAVEKAYVRLLPNGFGVSRSKATLNRLIKSASEPSVPNCP